MTGNFEPGEYKTQITGPYYKCDLYNSNGDVILSHWLDKSGHLENRTQEPDYTPFPQGVEEMATKINRTVVVSGKKRWIHANTEQEYADKLLQLVGGGPSDGEGHPFEEFAWNWFETYAKPNLATATVRLYSQLLRVHIIPAIGDLALEDVKADDLQRMFNGMDTSKETKCKVKRLLNQILSVAIEDDFLSKNPLKSSRIKITGTESTTTQTYSVEQMRYIIQHIADLSNPQDRTYLAIQALHPLRLEEVLGLKWGDVDLDGMSLHIRRAVTHPSRNKPEIKETKTVSSVRTVGLSALALPYLAPGNVEDFVIGGRTPVSYSNVRRMRERIKREIKFEEDITPMRFRTTVLTDLYEQTKDIKLTQAAAGHTTADMTLKHYVKGRSDVVQSAVAIDSVYNA